MAKDKDTQPTLHDLAEAIQELAELERQNSHENKKDIDQGKGLVLVDEKLLDWLRKQVEAEKYDSISHAKEVLILNEMQKK